MPTIEILAPVGSYESLIAAIQAGANAVYFGVGKLNMRSRSAQSFSIEDLFKIVDICKSANVRSYLTLNTIIYDNEMDEMKVLVDKAKEAGITAVIASDLSVLEYCKQQNVTTHISTQCNITNLQAVKFYSRYADVMVMARELSLQQVSEIVKGIEKENIKGPSGELVKIEIFVHGALCMAVSGKCYLSLDNMNYSANRGACLQLCRRSYLVTDKEEGFELEVDHEYIMSPKDLCTIGFIDKIIDAGATVLKIEGRGRGPEYVKTVTQCYKEAVEAVIQNTYSQEKVAEWENRLKAVFNRGFWDGYYLGRKMGEWSKRYGSQSTKKKLYIGIVTNYFSNLNVAEIKMETNDLITGEEIIITGPTTGVIEQTADEIRVNLQITDKTVKGEKCSIKTSELVRRGDKVYKLVQVEEKF
ncbi:MAG: U32 family peptidase [Bacteroidetes bacterium]|nr:U32 family peptidase [Bacteroidota bacterium]